jgi:hypothetical protein
MKKEASKKGGGKGKEGGKEDKLQAPRRSSRWWREWWLGRVGERGSTSSNGEHQMGQNDETVLAKIIRSVWEDMNTEGGGGA